jgi:four helix bundle protein
MFNPLSPMKENPILEKSFAFSLRIVRLAKYLNDERREFILSKELLVAGTHIGKHVKEAVNAESRQVFVNEFAVARRKASETEYWLQLLLQADLLTFPECQSIEADRTEIAKILNSILRTSKENV